MLQDFNGLERLEAVGLGLPVEFSSEQNNPYWNHDKQYALDQCDYVAEVSCGWCPNQARTGAWAMITSEHPRVWTDVILQGRANGDYWVTSFRLEYTLDGTNWMRYGYETFPGVNDRNTKNRVTLNPPIKARAIKIIVESYYKWPCMRFGALFINAQES